MKPYHNHVVGVLSMLLTVTAATAARCRETDRPPNVVLIMADDLGAECLGCYGSTSFETPHLDELARTGIRFENCYATPLCVTSRMQLMTGRYPFRTGWIHNAWGRDWHFDPEKETSFANLLKSAGYATCVVDKWMLCYDFKHRPQTFREAGFDEHYMWRLWDTSIPPEKRVGINAPITPGCWDAAIWKNGPCADGKDKYGPDLFCDYAIDFIERRRDRPFLAYWPMHLVHLESYSGGTTPPTPDTIHSTGKGDRDGKRIDKQRGMADMIRYMDKLVGRIVSTLDRLGIRENTLILFTGDNGTSRGIRCELGDRVIAGGKGKLSERGCRVPLVVNWKGVTPRGKVLDDLVDFTDFLPTLAEAAGAELPRGVKIDGRSFLPQLKGHNGNPRRWVYCQIDKRWFVRDKQWMLYNDGKLLDVTDRYAPKPAGATPESAAARERLATAMEALRRVPCSRE